MSYILNLISGKDSQSKNKISLEKYILENSYITKYLSKVVKDKSLVVYHVLFHLTWFEKGTGEITISWAKLGTYIRSEQGNIVKDPSTIKRRLPNLQQNDCITIINQRGSANKIKVHLPSEIDACKLLIEKDKLSVDLNEEDETDYYTNASKRLLIFQRDNEKCIYCLIDLEENNFVLDHIIPTSKGGSNKKINLVTSCESCNGRKHSQEPLSFLLSNYREHLISQNEYLAQKAFIEKLLELQQK